MKPALVVALAAAMVAQSSAAYHFESDLFPSFDEVKETKTTKTKTQQRRRWDTWKKEDNTAAEKLYPKGDARTAVKNQIDDAYDAANACLDLQDASMKRSEADYKDIVEVVRKCIYNPEIPPLASDKDITPNWSDLVSDAKTTSVKLKEVGAYWTALEKKDNEKVDATLPNGALKTEAKKKITAVYDAANACLDLQDANDKRSQADFKSIMEIVRKCIYAPEIPPLAMDGDVTPAWSDLITSPKTTSIKLKEVGTYWSELEKKDNEKVDATLPSGGLKTEAKKKIKAFYDAANACLDMEDTTHAKSQIEIEKLIAEVHECIYNPAPLPPLHIDGDIVPEWSSIVTNPKATSVKRRTVKAYWNNLRDDDDDAVNSIIPKGDRNNEAHNRIDEFYADAKKCLDKFAKLTISSKDIYKVVADSTRDCLYNPPTAPVLSIDNDVVPEWEDVVTDSRTARAKIDLLSPYFKRLESRDNDAVTKFFKANDPKRTTYLNMVASTYEKARKCSLQYDQQDLHYQDEYEQILDEIRACVYPETPAPPTGTPTPTDMPIYTPTDIVPTQTPTMVPTWMPTEIPTEPPTEMPTEFPTEYPTWMPTEIPTEAPTEMPTEQPTEGPTEEPTNAPTNGPDYIPIHDDVIVTPASQYVYKPASPIVAPFEALDINRDTWITNDEWTEYAARLRDVALERISRGWDSAAVSLLQQATQFHYAILNQCIQVKLAEFGTPTFQNDEAFAKFHDLVQSECYVKWRYSLLSGPPPFELIAKRENTITAADVERWLNRKVEIAKHDIGVKKIFEITPEEQKQLEHILTCAYKVFHAVGDRAIDRTTFYDELSNIERCVESFPSL